MVPKGKHVQQFELAISTSQGEIFQLMLTAQEELWDNRKVRFDNIKIEKLTAKSKRTTRF